MKNRFKILLLIVLSFSAISCKNKNLFYGVDEEDTRGPSITIDYPALNQNISGTFTILGRASDDKNSVLKIEVSTDGGSTWTLANGTSNWSVTLDSLAIWGAISGTRTIHIRATDTDYKRNTQQTSITYAINNTNPDLIGEIKDEMDLNHDGYHNQSEGSIIQYWWNYESTAVVGYEIILYNVTDKTRDIFVKNLPPAGTTTSYSGSEINPGSGSQGSLTTGVSGVSYGWGGASKIIFRFTAASNKKYYIAAKPYDSSGQRATAKISVSQTIDIVPPSSGTVSDPGNYSSSTLILFTWSGFSDGESGINYYEVQSSDDGTNWSSSQNLGTNTYITTGGYDGETFQDGETVYLRVRAVDKAGNGSAWEVSNGITVNTSVSNVGTITAVDTIRNAADGTRVVLFTWNEVADASGYKIQIYENTEVQLDNYQETKNAGALTNGPNTGITSVSLTTAAGTSAFQFTGEDGKKYYLWVKAYDDAGNESAVWSKSGSVLVDITPPDSSAASVSDASNGTIYPGQFFNSTSVTFTWSGFSDVESGIDYYEVRSSDDGTNWSNWQNVGTSTSVTTSGYNSETFGDGETVYLQVRAVDKTGNASAEKQSDGILIDTTPPDASGSTPTLTKIGSPGTRTGEVSWVDATDVGGSGIDYYEIEVTHSCEFVSYFSIQITATRSIVAGSLQEYPHGSQTTVIDDAPFMNGTSFRFTYDDGSASDYTTVIIRVYDRAGNRSQTQISSEVNIR